MTFRNIDFKTILMNSLCAHYCLCLFVCLFVLGGSWVGGGGGGGGISKIMVLAVI